MKTRAVPDLFTVDFGTWVPQDAPRCSAPNDPKFIVKISNSLLYTKGTPLPSHLTIEGQASIDLYYVQEAILEALEDERVEKDYRDIVCDSLRTPA